MNIGDKISYKEKDQGQQVLATVIAIGRTWVELEYRFMLHGRAESNCVRVPKSSVA